MPKKSNVSLVIWVVAFGALLIVSVVGRIYYVREDFSGQLLWSNNEAYLFISVAQRGSRVRYFEYPWEVFKKYVRAAGLSDDERRILTVIRFTTSVIERNIVKEDSDPASGAALYTPSGGHIFANCPYLGGVCIWAGDHFARASEEDQRKFADISKLCPDIDTEVNGWTKRGIGGSFSVNIGGRVVLLGRDEAAGGPVYRAVTISVRRQGQAPEEIWHLDGSPRRVSKSEYERIFSSHSGS